MAIRIPHNIGVQPAVMHYVLVPRKAKPKRPRKRLRLFVVGEFSPDPDDWVEGYDLVIAGNKREAMRIASGSPAVEVALIRPCLLFSVPVR